MKHIEKYIKLFLLLLLAGTFLNFNPGYYQFLRLCGTAGFLYLAYRAHRIGSVLYAFLWFVTAAFYIPLINFSIPGIGWKVIYFLSLLLIIISLFSQKKSGKK